MKRKRKWIKEYKCSLFEINILERLSFCKEPITDKKCNGCKHKDEDKEKRTK